MNKIDWYKNKLNNKYKVDCAVILACGMGKRLFPLTFDIPKCMIKVKGEVLIERQIMQIKAAGIEEIIIVVGYLKEKFEYLKSKYNVKLVYNEEYNKKNTLSSLYKVMPHILNKSFYITVADIYLDENVFNEYEFASHFKSVYIDHEHDEWRCILGEENEILKIERHSGPSYSMVGIAFFTKEKSKILFKHCEELYNKCGTENYYWEEIIYMFLNDFYKYYIYELPKNIFHEFDTFEELKEFFISDDYGSKTLYDIAKKLNVKQYEIENAHIENNDFNNKSFTFTLKNKKDEIYYYKNGNIIKL